MNPNTPYDQIIAAKLEQLPPLPAMADEIWLRIAVRLDEEMPTDDEDFGQGRPEDGPGIDSPVAPADNSWKGWSILLFMGAISLLLLFRTGNIITPRQPAEEAPKNYRILTPESAPPQPLDNRKDLPQGPEIARPKPEVPAPLTIKPDSLFKNSENLPLPADSLVGQTAADSQEVSGLNQAIREVPVKINPDSTTGRKRPVGVKGLDSGDYRIVPKQKLRDST